MLTLAEAFANDPLLEILAPDPARRVKLGLPMMSILLAWGMRYGRVWSHDDASAVAIWLHPESGPMRMPLIETGTDANIAFYRKRGFDIIGQADCYGHTLTGMVRRPRTPASGSGL